MTEDNRIPLTYENELTIESDNGARIKVIKLRLIGRGGTCLVYEGQTGSSVPGSGMVPVIIKEFYPLGVGIKRRDDMSLDITDKEAYGDRLEHYLDGLKEHEEYSVDFGVQVLPPVRETGRCNNTIYSLYNASKGRPLSEADFESLSLKDMVSIMESICNAIYKFHYNDCLYLDAKPSNFFYDMTSEDRQPRIYLFDFDSVVSLDDMHGNRVRYSSGTRGWMPVEQAAWCFGRQHDERTGKDIEHNPNLLGVHTDIYSIGAVFFWMLTKGKIPTEEDMEAIAAGSVRWESSSPFLSGISPTAGKMIKDILKDTLTGDPRVRRDMFPGAGSTRQLAKRFGKLYEDLEESERWQKVPKMLGIPRKNTQFVGRKDKLEEMENVFRKGDNVAVLFGQGGMGKTQLALKYAYDHSREYSFVHWIDAHTIASINMGLKNLLRAAEIPTDGTDEDILTQYTGFLLRRQRSCIVFDNVDMNDRLMLPVIDGIGSIVDDNDNRIADIIITTRTKQAIKGFRFLDVYTFSEEDAEEMLLQDSEDPDPEAAKELADRLHYHPLALDMARAYISETPGCSINTYLDYLNKGTQLLDIKVNTFDYQQSLKEVVSTTIETICKIHAEKAEAIKSFLYFSSLLSPNLISIPMFVTFAISDYKNDADKPCELNCFKECFRNGFQKDDLIRVLAKYSLVRENNIYLSIHELTQEIIRDYIWPSLTDFMLYNETVHGMLVSYLNSSIEPAKKADIWLNVAHIFMVEKDKYNKGYNIPNIEVNDALIMISVLNSSIEKEKVIINNLFEDQANVNSPVNEERIEEMHDLINKEHAMIADYALKTIEAYNKNRNLENSDPFDIYLKNLSSALSHIYFDMPPIKSTQHIASGILDIICQALREKGPNYLLEHRKTIMYAIDVILTGFVEWSLYARLKIKDESSSLLDRIQMIVQFYKSNTVLSLKQIWRFNSFIDSIKTGDLPPYMYTEGDPCIFRKQWKE